MDQRKKSYINKGTDIELGNEKKLTYQAGYPPEGHPYITWAEYGPNGNPTGLSGEIILYDESLLNVPHERLVIEEYVETIIQKNKN